MVESSDAVPGWPEAFRGSTAIAAGLVTPDVLRGPRFLRLFPGVHVPAPAGPPDLALRSRAAYRYVEGRGALAGYSAAELLGASCGPRNAPAEVVVPRASQRGHAGLLVHRGRLAPDEVTAIGDVRLTTPLRTAYDLARRGDLVERVVAVDALANKHRFHPDVLLHLAARHRGARGNEGVAEVLAHADRRSGSPMETRLRMLITQSGLPRPEAQWAVQDPHARSVVWLDLAYPDHMIGVEYEGADHAARDAVLRDVGRYTALVDRGWRIYRYTKFEIRHQPHRITAQLARALQQTRSTSAGS